MKLSNGSSVGHVPDVLAPAFCTMVDIGAITHMKDGDTAVPRSASKSVLVLGGGIEIPCKYVQKDLSKVRDNGRQTLQEAQKKSKSDCVTCSLCPRVTHYTKKHPFYIPL